MKMAVVHGPGDLRLDEVARPKAGPGDIVIKLVTAGICGSDVHYCELGGTPGSQSKAPLPLGHEFAGRIVETGAEIVSFAVGDRVAYNSFNSPADLGRGAKEGGFSEYLLLRNVEGHRQSLVRVPEGVSFDHAALVEPISVAMHTVNRADPKPGESVAVFGVGPIGLGVIIALRWRGIDDIVAFDLSPMRLDRAVKLGARAGFNPRERKPAEALGELRGYDKMRIGGGKFPRTDIYIEATGAPGLLADIVGFCNLASRIVTVAIQREDITLDANAILAKELSLMGSLGYPTEFPQVMAKLAEAGVDPESMISHRFEFGDFLKAFETASDPGASAKVLVQFP